LLREDRNEVRLRARAPELEAVSRIGAGDTLLAGFLSARVGGKSFEDAVRIAVATGAASVLEAGPGRFDLREASRLTPLVTVERLERVAS
jgi:fructose-1-phosphate kinase PfkB-like protein